MYLSAFLYAHKAKYGIQKNSGISNPDIFRIRFFPGIFFWDGLAVKLGNQCPQKSAKIEGLVYMRDYFSGTVRGKGDRSNVILYCIMIRLRTGKHPYVSICATFFPEPIMQSRFRKDLVHSIHFQNRLKTYINGK